MSTEEEVEAHLGAVFDEFVELIGETKQAVWTATSSERRQVFDGLSPSSLNRSSWSTTPNGD